MLVPPVALAVAGVSDESEALAFGFSKIVRNVDFVAPPVVALMLADVKLLEELVVTVKLFALFPSAMNTLAGTCAAGASLDNDTVMPPDGAGVTSPTVPRTESPATTDGWSVTSAMTSGIAGKAGSIRSTAPCMPAEFP